MKTAVTVLQEMMVKLGEIPDYECISQSGPQHLAQFEYRCIARGVSVTAVARSKKEAKQEVARVMLLALAARGDPVPPPYGAAPPARHGETPSASSTFKIGSTEGPSPCAVGPLSYVALLKELCEEYRLGDARYELVGDAGPAHRRHFTMRAQLGEHSRLATATTKKAARQLAAQQLYTYMRENLARLTKDFVEDEALVRSHDRVMDRYVELREDVIFRPDLSQRISDYHLGLNTHLDPEKLGLAKAILDGPCDDEEALLDSAAAAMGLAVSRSALGAVCMLELAPASPPLAFAGRTPAAAAAAALTYLRLALF